MRRVAYEVPNQFGGQETRTTSLLSVLATSQSDGVPTRPNSVVRSRCVAISPSSYATACTIASAPPAEFLRAVVQQLPDCLMLIDCAVSSIGNC